MTSRRPRAVSRVCEVSETEVESSKTNHIGEIAEIVTGLEIITESKLPKVQAKSPKWKN